MNCPGCRTAIRRVVGFDKDQAETLMRGMVRELGADPAATDSSRVMRVPGFYNHKRASPHFVMVQNLSDNVYRPERFPNVASDEPARMSIRSHVADVGVRPTGVPETQSERDWRFALRSLARGKDADSVMRDIEAYRPDKANPGYYARHTVEKARGVLKSRGSVSPADDTPKRGR